MTKSAKKPVKVSRDSLDLDLDARLDQATSTLTLDEEPVVGDAIDQVLARAKKELDTNSSPNLPPISEKLGNIRPVKSESMTSLENQLTAAMETSMVSDDELDNLLGGTGFDFDSLLGEASDELKPQELEPKSKRKSKPKPEPEIVAAEELVEVVKFDKNEFDTNAELIVEPDITLNDLVDSITFEETLTVDLGKFDIDDSSEKFNDFDDVDTPLVEISTSDESFDDDLNAMQQFDGLNEVMENKNDTAAGFDLLDDVTDSVTDSVTETDYLGDDWTKQLDAMDDSETEDPDIVPPVDLISTMTAEADYLGDDWMNQLEGMDDDEAEEETEAEKPEPVASVNLAKPAVETPDIADDDDDWMKQLDGLDDDAETEKPEPISPVNLAKPAVEIPEIADDDDDWMKQLDALDDDAETEKPEPVAPVNLAKPAVETPEIVDDDDNWAKKLDGLENHDDHDEDTAQMLMDAGHDADDESKSKSTRLIDEDEALTASEFSGNQDSAMSQLRASQDSIDSKNKQQFVDVEKKRKKTAMFGYMALGVGVIGLLGSAGIGWLSYDTQNDTSTLSQSVTVLEEKVNTFLAKNPEKEIENIKLSVEQLNQKVEKIAAAQISVPPVALAPIDAPNDKTAPIAAVKPNDSVDLLNSKAAAAPAMESVKTESPSAIALTIAAPPSDISLAPHAAVVEISSLKPVESVKLADMTKKSAKKADAVKTVEVDKKAAEIDKKVAEKAEKAESELLMQKIAKAEAIAKAAAEASYKNDAPHKADRYSGRMTRGMAHSGSKDKTTKTNNVATKTNGATPAKEVLHAEIKSQKSVAAGKYSVNVISYQQEWFAQSKAAELKQKGIPVQVVPVDASKPGTKFRLKVGGFKNKAEASAYADKIKKSSGGNEPWVGSD
ncbi:MAG: SPOR domain-containing protein [Methylococcaceae bacterium]